MRRPKFDPSKPCSWCNPCPASFCDCGPCKNQMCSYCFPTGQTAVLPPKPTVVPRTVLKPDRWIQRYACAVATMQRLDGSTALTTHVTELVKAGGLTQKACIEACVDEYDLKVLFPEKEKAQSED